MGVPIVDYEAVGGCLSRDESGDLFTIKGLVLFIHK